MNSRSLNMKLIVTLAVAFFMLSTGVMMGQTTTPEWRRHTSLPLALAGHGTILLPTGDLLVAGGVASDGSVTRSSYLYSASTGTFRPTINQLVEPHAYHALVGTGSGASARVFAIGGYDGSAGSYRSSPTVEVLELDPSSGNWRWRVIGSLGSGRGDCRAAWDGGRFVVVTGGYEQSGGALRSGIRSSASERIDVVGMSVGKIGGMSTGRAEHATARIIGDNDSAQILVAGGEAVPTSTATQILLGVAWDPIANPPLSYHTAGVGVGDLAGIARLFGGFDAAGAPTNLCEWYDVKRGWRAAPRMNTPRARFDAAFIAGVTDTATAYLVAGGTGSGGAIADAEVFTLPTGSSPNGLWSPFPSLIERGSERRIAIAGSNLPLVTGATPSSDHTEIFQPFRANDLAFGDEEVGRRSNSAVVSIENSWLLPVRARRFRIVGSAEFTYRGDTADFTVPAGGRRTLRVYFQPSLPGDRAGLLLFDVGAMVDTIRLTGRGTASQIAIINSPLDFGTQLLSTRRVACIHVLKNNGSDTAVIDSIVIAPAGTFRLVSPLGRVRVAPGDSLQLCVEFIPGTQGPVDATATLHIAARSFSLQVLGRGIRRFLTASTISSDCDTVLYAPGVQTSGFVRLENRGDTAVHITMPLLKGSAFGLFNLADSSQFPRDLRPGEFVQVEVIFSPQRESQEIATIDFPNDGDTSAGSSLCFIARSRYLSVSQSSVELGSICLGDTARSSITIENPGGFDSVGLLGASIDPAAILTLSGFSPGTLGPREYITLLVRWTPEVEGALSGTLVVRSSRGDVTIPVHGNALASARFKVGDGAITIGDTALLPIDLLGSSSGSSLTSIRLTFEYDPRLLMPVRIASLPGGAQVDGASALTLLGKGKATLDVRWNGAPSAPGPAFGLFCDVLRGDANITAVALSGESRNGVCIARAVTTLSLLPACGDNGGFIRTDSAQFLTVAPVPASGTISIVIASPSDQVWIEIVNMRGEVVEERRLSDGHPRIERLEIAIAHLAPGAYLVRARNAATVVATQRIMIRR